MRNTKRRRIVALSIVALLLLIRPLAALDEAIRFDFAFDGRILIPLRVNDSKPLNIILDTGLGSGALILMHLETGEELGLTYVRTVAGARGAGTGANKDLHLTAGEDLSLPGFDLGKVATAVMDERREDSGFHNVGVLGAPVFIKKVVEIDFEKSAIALFDPETFDAEKGWEEIPLTFERNLPIIETTLSIDGKTEIPARLMIDTGGKPSLALAKDAAKGIVPPAKTVRFLAGTGLRGDVFADHGRISHVKVGSHDLANVISGFWTGDEAPILKEINVDGVLSLGSLYRFNLVFDYNHRRMLIKPNRFFSDPFELNMAGMAIEETPSGETIVYYVSDGSEAATKGLRNGDVLEAIDGRAIGTVGYLELKKLFERDGATVTVGIRRDGRRQRVDLALARIL